MTDTSVVDLETKTLGNARRQFVELYGSALALNAYFKLVIVLLILANGALAGAVYWILDRYRNIQPLIVRVDPDGRAEVGQFAATEYRPDAAEIRYFLRQFTMLHFARNRSRADTEHASSLLFLAPRVPHQTCSDQKVPEGAKEVETFMSDPKADEIKVDVIRAVLRQMDRTPYEAEVRFQCVYVTPGGRERARRTYTAQLKFDRLVEIPHHFRAVNPLGFQIQDLHVDDSFIEEGQ
jgi:type IV secretory pathway component VirB8